MNFFAAFPGTAGKVPPSPGLVANLQECYQQLYQQQLKLQTLQAGLQQALVQETLSQCHAQPSPVNNQQRHHRQPAQLSPGQSDTHDHDISRSTPTISVNDLNFWPPVWYPPFAPPWVNPYFLHPQPSMLPSPLANSSFPSSSFQGMYSGPLRPQFGSSFFNQSFDTPGSSAASQNNTPFNNLVMTTSSNTNAQNNLGGGSRLGRSSTFTVQDDNRAIPRLSERSIHNNLQHPVTLTRHTENTERDQSVPPNRLLRNNTFTLRGNVVPKQQTAEQLHLPGFPWNSNIKLEPSDTTSAESSLYDNSAMPGTSRHMDLITAACIGSQQPQAIPKLNLERVVRNKKRRRVEDSEAASDASSKPRSGMLTWLHIVFLV